MNFGFDLDGTVCNTSFWLENLCKEYPDTTFVPEDYENGLCGVHCPEEYRDEIMCKIDKDYMTEVSPYPGVAQIINDLKTKGHTISIVTGRGFKDEKYSSWIRYVTVRWLHAYGIQYDAIIFTGLDKGLMCKQYGIDFLFEDSVEFAKGILEQSPNTTLCIMKHAWNEEFVRARNLLSISSWDELKIEGLPI